MNFVCYSQGSGLRRQFPCIYVGCFRGSGSFWLSREDVWGLVLLRHYYLLGKNVYLLAFRAWGWPV